MDTTSHLPALLGACALAWVIATSGYNMFFHPLAKYPGPFWSKVTGWYEFFNVADGGHHLWLYEVHQRYGSVVRVGPNRLSYNTVEALQAIYTDRKANVRKAGFSEAIALLKGSHRNLHTINDRQVHNARRRLISHAFSEDALHSSQDFILKCIRSWCEIVKSKAKDATSWTSDMNMSKWAGFLTEDILAELSFGESFGACQRGSSDTIKLVGEGSKQAQMISWMPMGPNFYRLLKLVVDYGLKHKWEALKPQIDYESNVEAMIQRRLSITDSSRKDFFHYILQAKDQGTGATITSGEMNVEAGLLFGAGTDTTATCLAACLFYLTKHPEALARIHAEIRNTFSDVEEIVLSSKLKSLVYLRACIDEALRISPPVPGPMLREVMAGGLAFDGDVIPAGVQVSVPIFAIHHNEKYFPDSFIFKPERWLDDSPDVNKEAFCPFSAGIRVCIGRNLAYLDLMLSLSRLLFLFDVQLAPGVANKGDEIYTSNKPRLISKPEVHYYMKDWFVAGRTGPVVQFRARQLE